MSLINVAIVAVDGFSPFHYSVPCILFGDSVSGEKRFNVTICAETPGFLTSKDGFALNATEDYSAIGLADIVVVPYWQHVLERPPQTLLDSLVQARDSGAEIVGLCLGSFVLAYAGILDGKRAATHWEFERQFQSLFPNVRLDINALYVDDGNIITSAGTAAALDCCLYIIRQRFGSVVANQIARRMIVPPHREGGQAQFIERPVARHETGRLAPLLDAMRQDLRREHRIADLARSAAMSERTFLRRFAETTGTTPGEWLIAARVDLAKQQLEAGLTPIEAVATAAGFASVDTLRHHFRRRVGLSPSDYRARFSRRRGAPAV